MASLVLPQMSRSRPVLQSLLACHGSADYPSPAALFYARNPSHKLILMIRALLTVAALFTLLSACEMGTGFATSRSAPVLNGALNVGVPPGYCVDRSAGRVGSDNAVVLMGRCQNTDQAAAALISVSVGNGGSAGVMTAGGPALAAFFTSPQGRATLSREGRAADVRVIEVVSVGDAFLIHLIDRAVGEHWRAVTGVAARLVTISVTGTEAVPLPPAESRRVLDMALAALDRANP